MRNGLLYDLSDYYEAIDAVIDQRLHRFLGSGYTLHRLQNSVMMDLKVFTVDKTYGYEIPLPYPYFGDEYLNEVPASVGFALIDIHFDIAEEFYVGFNESCNLYNGEVEIGIMMTATKADKARCDKNG